jgi:molybdopterin-binding protein
MKKISARNVLEGNITEIKKGATTSHVLIDVKGSIITVSITNESVEELALQVGKKRAESMRAELRADVAKKAAPKR